MAESSTSEAPLRPWVTEYTGRSSPGIPPEPRRVDSGARPAVGPTAGAGPGAQPVSMGSPPATPMPPPRRLSWRPSTGSRDVWRTATDRDRGPPHPSARRCPPRRTASNRWPGEETAPARAQRTPPPTRHVPPHGHAQVVALPSHSRAAADLDEGRGDDPTVPRRLGEALVHRARGRLGERVVVHSPRDPTDATMGALAAVDHDFRAWSG